MHVFCICTCSAQWCMFHTDRRSRNTLIIIITCLQAHDPPPPPPPLHPISLFPSHAHTLTLSKNQSNIYTKKLTHRQTDSHINARAYAHTSMRALTRTHTHIIPSVYFFNPYLDSMIQGVVFLPMWPSPHSKSSHNAILNNQNIRHNQADHRFNGWITE